MEHIALIKWCSPVAVDAYRNSAEVTIDLAVTSTRPSGSGGYTTYGLVSSPGLLFSHLFSRECAVYPVTKLLRHYWDISKE